MDKYEKLVEALRRSVPDPESLYEIESEVMEKIALKKQRPPVHSLIAGYLFGWVYVGWIRRSLITGCLILVVLFMWQQHNIITEIEMMKRQMATGERMTSYDPSAALERKLIFSRMSAQKARDEKTFSEKEVNDLLKSINELNIRYRDLIEVINDDPELKAVIEKKLEQKMDSKIKL